MSLFNVPGDCDIGQLLSLLKAMVRVKIVLYNYVECPIFNMGAFFYWQWRAESHIGNLQKTFMYRYDSLPDV